MKFLRHFVSSFLIFPWLIIAQQSALAFSDLPAAPDKLTDQIPLENDLSCPANLQFEPASHINWKGRIMIIWSGLGEFAWAKRLENACKKLGWECIISIDPVELSEYDRLVQDKPSTSAEIQTLIKQYQPDCVISLKWDCVYSKEVPHYLSATGNFEWLTNPVLPSRDLLAFKGILNVTSIEYLKSYFEHNGKKFNSMEWYPSSTATEYRVVKPQTIFYCGFQWDSMRNGAEYRKMFSLLDQGGYLDIYGPVHKWDCAPNSVRGMTFDEEEFQLAMQKSGIVLVLHTQGNLDQGAPAARVFEAAAAGCVIISDKHPFIVREFGDCILYIDHTQPGEILFEQINTYRKWILDHPQEAELMASKAHAIFSAKFTLEKQLKAFKDFHLMILEESN